MVELALDHPGKLHGGEFEEKIVRIEAALEDNFVQTKKCFEEGDSDVALELLKKDGWVNDNCDEILVDVVKEKDRNIKAWGCGCSVAVYALAQAHQLPSMQHHNQCGQPLRSHRFRTQKRIRISCHQN